MFKRLPVSFLIASNLVPLLGVFLAGWDAASIVLVYWAENLVIGAYNILKMLTVAPFSLKGVAGRLFIILFFIIHYGGFAAGHGMFLLGFLEVGSLDSALSFDDVMSPEKMWPGPLVLLQMLFHVMQVMWVHMPSGFNWALVALVISHGVSYVVNFIIAGERNNTSAKHLMGQPYGRVVIMHVAIIAAGFFIIKLGSPAALLVSLVVAKTTMDVYLHNKSHKQYLFGHHDGKKKKNKRPDVEPVH